MRPPLPNPDCSRGHRPFHPEAESLVALPHHEFGLDVLALVGRLRHAEHRSVPEIHRELTGRGVTIALRSVSNLLDRYDELRALATVDRRRLHALLRERRRVVLAIDGLQPDVGHEVLWVLRDCLSGEILLARGLLSATIKDLEALMAEVRQALPVPITAAISDGQGSIRKAVASALPGVPHQQCHFHYLREAAEPIYEADRHARKELKKLVRGVRPIERGAEKEPGERAEAVRDHCAAVRAALTDDGRPPLAAPGLKLRERFTEIATSLDRVSSEAGSLPRGLERLRRSLHRGSDQTAALWPPVQATESWVERVACLLENKSRRPAKRVRRGLSAVLSEMRGVARRTRDPAVAERLRWFVIPARDAPTTVIIRRGPSRWHHLILWDMERDAFTEGAWFRGRIDEERCDLSPDGKLFVYFAYKGIRLGESGVDSWTAVSRPPWLRPPVVWPQGSTYGGGGRFVGDRRLAPRGITGLDRPYPGHPPGLELVSTETTPEVHLSTGEVPGSDWCGHDHRGRVISTLGGRLFRHTGAGDVRVSDFSDRRPRPEPPPEWASRWP